MFIAFIKQKQTETSKKVKIVHYDGGTEIANATVADFLRNNGTKLTTTEAYTPQHNSVAENAHQTLMNGVRANMHHANATTMLWGEAVMATIHTLVRTTTRVTGDVTPYELWTKKKPRADRLHVFGSDAYYHIHKEKRDNKLSERAKKAIFIGYDSDNETYYRLLDVDSMKVVVVGDVRVFENSFAEMKRLKEEMKREENEEESSEVNNDDYLDDLSLLKMLQTDAFKENERKNARNNDNDSDNENDSDKERTNDDKERMNESKEEKEKETTNEKKEMKEKTNEEEEKANEDQGNQEKDNQKNEEENEENDNEEKDEDVTESKNNEEENEDVTGSKSEDDNDKDEKRKQKKEVKKRAKEKRIEESKKKKQQQQPTRTSKRVTAKPFNYDPSTYYADINNIMLPYALSVSDGEPTTYTQAITTAECERWIQAMNDELASQEKNKTWTVVTRTSDMNVIGCRWVYKIKKDMNGNIQRYKARLVAKGYNQRYGVDYDLTHAPVLRYNSLRVILALSATANRRLYQLDIKTAFLNAEVEEDIYMEVPEGVRVDGSKYVCKLNKALYGIKQAPHVWNKNINAYLITLGYTPCEKDPCIYHKNSKTNNNIIIGLFVDDILISCTINDTAEWNEDKKTMNSKYELNDMGEAHYLLGMKIEKKENQLQLHQSKYVMNKLTQFRMNECSETTTTPETTVRLSANDGSNKETEETLYRAIVGGLIYIQTSTRPDIAHAVNMVTRYMKAPTTTHMTAAKRILRYLRSTVNSGLVYKNSGSDDSVIVTAYCDSDWGGDQDEGKSTTGYCMFINNNLVSWNTHKQETVSLSSAEAELYAIVDATKEIMWLVQLLREMNVKVITPVTLFTDNQSAIKMATHTAEYDRSKHIRIRTAFVRENMNNNTINLTYIPTEHQLADMFTKALSTTPFITQRDRLMHRIEQ
jgi:hypothetical protein